MAIEIPRSLVEYILLGPTYGRRQLQDSPILADVWLAFARKPDARLDLLITPLREQPAGTVAKTINGRVKHRHAEADIGYLQGIVVAKLDFEDLLYVVVPMTEWWHKPRNRQDLATYTNVSDGVTNLGDMIGALLPILKEWKGGEEEPPDPRPLAAIDRYVTLAGLILWARGWPPPGSKLSPDATFTDALNGVAAADIAGLLQRAFSEIQKQDAEELVWQISRNRPAMPALERSVPAVKADAARTLFSVSCEKITWAVIDSGIDRTHRAFEGKKGSRVKKTLDFSQFRQIVSLSNTDKAVRWRNLDALAEHRNALPVNADALLLQLATNTENGLPVSWELVEALVEITPEQLRPPVSEHGTHVAGIIAARKIPAANPQDKDEGHDGMCPDISLYDFRVLGQTAQDTEFAVIAALQYIRHLNARNLYTTIHGANLSLSIPHDVRNYACGRTPVCIECERLVDSGVVVIAAAGNRGYQSFETKNGSYEGYVAFSVTDPGNADGVITVGATHRYSPHTYGVSFFSSRGPTGDGRPKPDLVAPGERISGPVLGGQWADHDGTSMAAPHVSGAAAMLMARYPELIGEPRRIKRILCESATDLGRERSFQGNGMLDVLRAFQSI